MELIVGKDDAVAEWAIARFGYDIVSYDWAFGVVKGDTLVGAVFTHGYTGCDIEVSYFGVLTIGIIRQLGRIFLDQLGVSRITVRTAKNNKLMKEKLRNIGFEFEGVRKHGYGKYDALMYGLYGAKMFKLAGRKLQ